MNDILDIAKEAAQRAGRLVASMLGTTAIEQKDTTYNLVTEADRRSETLVADFLMRAMPGSSLLSEEQYDNKEKLAAERLWIVDPLDGTTNFAYGISHFGVSVAYAEKGTILAGAVYDPMRDELFSASTGKGAYCNKERIHVSTRSLLSQSLIATGFYYDRGAMMEKTLRALHALYKENIRCIRRMGAASLDLTWLACGRFDAYFEYTLSPWDFAAGLLILREAGGTASNIDGTQADLLTASGLLCSNGLVHDALLRCILDPRPF